MIGLALVVFVTIFANGLRASVEDLIDRTLAGDIAVLHDDGFSPIPAAIGPAVAKVDGVAAVSSPIRDTQTEIKGVDGTKYTHAIEPATLARGLQLRLEGRLRRDAATSSATTASCSRRRRPPRASSRSATEGRRSPGPSGDVDAHRARHLQGRRAARGHRHGPGPVRSARRAEARVEHPRQDRRGRERARGPEARDAGARRRSPRRARARRRSSRRRTPTRSTSSSACSTRCWR